MFCASENLSGCTGELARVVISARQMVIDINQKEEEMKAVVADIEAKQIMDLNKKAEEAQQKKKLDGIPKSV